MFFFFGFFLVSFGTPLDWSVFGAKNFSGSWKNPKFLNQLSLAVNMM